MPKDYTRTSRIAHEIQIYLAKFIEREIKDPRLGVVTITGVEVSRDLAHAKIHVVVRDEKQAEISLQVLNKAAGFLRRSLGKELSLRIIPELHFFYDESSVYGRRIDELLQDVPPADENSDKE